jgi:glycosyltransferase involved in cell wall biosynthesis
MLSYTSAVIIALDATPLIISTGGVARYTAELARALAASHPDDEFWLLSDQPLPKLERAPQNIRHGNVPETKAGRKWWLWGLYREMTRLRIDLFHGTDFSVPYLPFRPAVMTIHDLSPWLDKAWQPDAGRIRRRTPLMLRAGLATMVITPSEAVRRAAISRWGLAADRVVAVPLAASEHFRPVACQPAAPPYVLFVGTLEPRKNVVRLIEAWREIKRTHEVDLVLAGRTRTDCVSIAPEPGLRLLGAVPDEDLPALYSGALAVVYPSLYEGFGLPVLEAMQCGALVITSRDPAILELSGDAALHVDAADTPALANALAAACDTPQNFAALRDRALARSQDFSWLRTAKRTWEVYAEARRIFRK